MNKLARLGFTALFATALGGCLANSGSVQNTGTDDEPAPLQGGESDANDPAVGLIWFGNGYCTGTLIAPNVVLTAGHCVQDPIQGFYTGPGTSSATISSPGSNMTAHAVMGALEHPSYDAGNCPNTTFDLGLVRLAAPIEDIAPLPYAKSSSGVPATGTSCEAIGFGQHQVNGQEMYMEKRDGTETVQGAGDTYVTVAFGTAIADHGDSGGPLVCNGIIAGATSCHTDGDYPTHQSEYYARVDAAGDWIDSVVTSWAPPAPSGTGGGGPAPSDGSTSSTSSTTSGAGGSN